MSYYRHYDLDTRIGLIIGEWMYRARNGSTGLDDQPPVEPPHGAGGCADSLPPIPAGSIVTPHQPLKSLNVTQSLLNVAGVLNAIFVVLVTTAAFVIGPLLLFFVDLR